MNLAILNGYKLTFSTSTATALGSDLFYRSLEDHYTPYGLIAPHNGGFSATYQMLEGNLKYSEELGPIGGCLIITHDGSFYENRHGNIHRFIVTPDVQKIFARMGDHDAVSMALHLTKNDGQAAIKLLSKAFRFRYTDYVTVDIRNVAKKLTELGYTKPFAENYFTTPDSYKERKRAHDGQSGTIPHQFPATQADLDRLK